jgi:hypothetical protein
MIEPIGVDAVILSVKFSAPIKLGLGYQCGFLCMLTRRPPSKDTKHWLWRAVDADGYVLEAFVQSWRDRKVALRLMPKPPA